MKRKSPKKYLVGYRRPPSEHRFKPGNKEHLKRTKNRKREGILFRDIARGSVKVLRKGSVVYASRMQVMIDNYVAAAVRGDIRAAACLLKLHGRSREIGDLEPQVLYISRVDAEL